MTMGRFVGWSNADAGKFYLAPIDNNNVLLFVVRFREQKHLVAIKDTVAESFSSFSVRSGLFHLDQIHVVPKYPSLISSFWAVPGSIVVSEDGNYLAFASGDNVLTANLKSGEVEQPGSPIALFAEWSLAVETPTGTETLLSVAVPTPKKA
ncbi:hypothetical protein [Rhodoblastus sp.]|uniref:hypothetical protein n=1 Tax=Rhodoblastus sp. TaxID=1962975 RepID=UPI002626DE06|nr:hypothetical protein [Rhodoblastus sp.]